MDVKELDENTWLITRGEGQASTHNYLLEGEDRAVLIDTGLETEELQKIVGSLTNKPVVVIHTHGHIDHIGNDQQFEEIMLHPKDFNLYWTHSSAAFRKEFFKEQPEKARLNKQSINQNVELEPLADGMTIDLGGRKLEVNENPGHTQGCISLIEEAKKAIYIGDMVCEMGVLMHFSESTSIVTYKQSLIGIQSKMASDYQLYPGHQKTPLSSQWVAAYIECAEELIQKAKRNATDQDTNELQFYSKGNATISYTSEKIMENLHGED